MYIYIYVYICSFPSNINGMRQRDKAIDKALSGLVW